MKRIAPDAFVKLRDLGSPMFDVRSPGEYTRGHIPGAINIPLLTDQERARVGTLYKQKGREVAMDAGLEILAPKALPMITRIRDLAPEKEVLLYCWRGGMRSGSLAWLLDLYGFKVYLLQGGYKAWKLLQAKFYERRLPLTVLAGYTGSGKTQVLWELAKAGEQVIDLETLANHRGSAFGSFGMDKQPQSEHFTNLLFEAFRSLDLSRPVWIEDESLAIGRVHLPHELYHLMSETERVFIDIPRSSRAAFLESVYGSISVEDVLETLDKIAKRMGGQNVNAAKEAIQRGDRKEVVEYLLAYYDKGYLHALGRKLIPPAAKIPFREVDPQLIAQELLEWKYSKARKRSV